MTREEAIRQTIQADNLRALGFTQDEAEKLRRVSMTLHRWHEMESGTDNGCLKRGANPTGLTVAGDLLDISLRLMKCRMTTRSAHFRKDLEDQVRLFRGYVTAIEQEEGRGK